MKFRELLNDYFINSKYSKVELSEKIRILGKEITAGYIGNLLSGVNKPPPLETLQYITKALRLNKEETDKIIALAYKERAEGSVQDYIESGINENLVSLFGLDKPKIKEQEDSYNLSPEILKALKNPKIREALEDPIARKAMVIVHQNSEKSKEEIRKLLEKIKDLHPDKLEAILKLCT